MSGWATCLVLGAIELLSPRMGATVELLPDCQRRVMAHETMSARLAELSKGTVGDVPARWRKSNPVVFEWRTTDGEKGPWELCIGKSPDLSDARSFVFEGRPVDPASGLPLPKDEPGDFFRFEDALLNLEVGARYYWRVTGCLTCGRQFHARVCACDDRRGPVRSGIGEFATGADAPRWIAVEGRVGNFRDLGGRVGRNGRRVRQGLVFRSQGLNDNSADGVEPGRNRLMVSDREYLTKVLGIRTDLDLRTDCETGGMNGVSPLGANVRYIHRSSPLYAGCFRPEGMKTMAENFRVFCDRANYPVLFHCIGGADRTGALAYVLNGILGVERRELETDWESTYYPNIPGADESLGGEHVWNSEWHFEEGFMEYGGEDSTWNERIASYLLACGVTDEEIASFRSIMLEE